ncbi:ABC transporter G family member 44 isoform X1 [Dendrobium catenatum]|uniref:ABC transporter G family member 44 isoform X1 n=1 Tax=Dendrobium catenatum TaxID=906689 RepID=UPI00109EEA39|nr:ABC transporter G family member 44 isoform X1 [Dendrobium catenatum]
MEEIYMSGSMRRSKSIWRGAEDQIFSRSFDERNEIDDEEALVWAALEKLPTYDRVRKGVLSLADGDLREIDVKSLGLQERRTLLERLVKVAEEDHERFLLKLKNRIDRVGIDFPTVEMRFEDLTIEAEAYVGSRSLPSFFNAIMNNLEAIANYLHITPSKKRPFTILHNINGIIKPRRMTLLLGPPGSGKTSMLLALAGKLSSDLKVSGKVTYNGHGMDEFVPQRTAAYISQHDLHMGEMTVRETLMFSARCQGVGCRYDMLTELSRREKAANIKPDPDIDVFMKARSMEGKETGVNTDYIMKILGLDICADTMIGDEMLRGISGGQKRRVTTGEMIVGPAQALLMDEISNGLDSSTTFQIIKSLKQITQILGGTTIISLLQPAPETYELFDDIILLSDGLIVYQGPRRHVLEFFHFMGFSCPERKGVADFLQEVTSKKDQQQYWVHHDKPYRFISVTEFAEAFQSFHVGKELTKELSISFDKSKSHPAALTTSKYGVSTMELLKACAERELLLLKRNSFVYAFRSAKVLVMTLMMMTVFLRTKMHRRTITDGIIFLGALFFVIINIMFNGFSELSMTIAKLPVFFKQRDSLFYPAWTYAIPTWIVKIPFSVIEVTILVMISYYVVGYDPNIERFIKQYVVLLLVNQMAAGKFRFVGAIGRNMFMAAALSFYMLFVFLVLGGFIIAHGDIKKFWIWGYWMSPLMYSQTAVSVNEFLGNSWSHKLPGSNETLGVAVLKSRGMFTEAKWYWIGVVALLGYVFIFNFLFAVSLSYLKPIKKGQPALSEEAVNERQMNIIKKPHHSSFERESSTHQSGSRNNSTKFSTLDSNPAELNTRKQMALPFLPLSLTFDNIKYSVDMPQEMKADGAEDRLMLLKGVSGCFRPGVLTALMGVSGAGKTTLMDVLAGRKTGGYIEGNITISGYPKKQETFARVSGYCEQNDIHSPHVTVHESLVYSAWLRLPVEVDSAVREMFIEEVMELVEMTSLRGALVGLPGVNGLSTEQRKRLTIAVELIANPSIIFMDEPTSGLDARAAAIVMRAVRNTVDTGRTVVCTIHQPSIDIFEAFDELFLMKRGGEEIYVGPLGHNSFHLIKYFEGIQRVSKIKDGHNPATWMLEVTTPAQENLLGISFTEVYKNSELYQRNKAIITENSIPPPGSQDLYFPTQYSQPFLTQCLACLWKQHLSYWRNTSYTVLRFVFTVMIALMLGTIFWNLGGKKTKQQDLFNALGSMYSAVLFIGISYSNGVQPVVAIERTVFYRERAAGMYSAIPYAFGQIVIEQPYILIQSIIYSILVYAMIGFEWTAAKFFWYLFFTYFTLLYFTYYGMLAVSLTPSLNIASIIVAGFYSVWNLFGGFIVPRPAIPIWWRWYYWACPVSWTLYGLLVSQYGDVEENLDTNQTVAEFLRSYFGFKHDFLGVVAFMVVFFAFFFAFLFGFAIKTLNFQRR